MRHPHSWEFILLCVGLLASPAAAAERHPATADRELPLADGFRGIWYSNTPTGDAFKHKYSGGLATYPQQHRPIAIYAPAARKTFFVYGGRYADTNRLLHLISYFDHETGQVARPRILLDKGTDDAHDNPTLAIDEKGFLYIFSNAHGRARPAYVHRSRRPFDIAAFELVWKTNFSYGQPWSMKDYGLALLHVQYAGGRFVYQTLSQDGSQWSEPELLAKFGQGHYHVSWCDGERLGLVLNYHPPQGGLNARTNLYYLESADGGDTWRTAAGERLKLPLTSKANPALAIDYESQGKLVYLKDLKWDRQGKPLLLYVTSGGYRPGPLEDPRELRLARFVHGKWRSSRICDVDHNYDFGELAISEDRWRVVVADRPGPQPWLTGGDITLWESRDGGEHWKVAKKMTDNSPRHHTYPRIPLGAQEDFFAIWADGDPRQLSPSRLYYATGDGRVFQLPETCSEPMCRPRRVFDRSKAAAE